MESQPAQAPQPVHSLMESQPAQFPQPSLMESQAAQIPQLMYKNRLQQFTQKYALPIPTYKTQNEGLAHIPKFRSTVSVGGVAYVSPQTFLHLKEAEQDAARVALNGIQKKIKDQGCSIIHEDLTFCKSILNEFAVKMTVELPTYTTTKLQARLPAFISNLVFHGKTFTGTPARNKKDAEQLAARNVIQHILDTESGPCLSEIIIAKRKLYEAVPKVSSNNMLAIVPSLENSAQLESHPDIHPDVQASKKPKLEQLCETSAGSVGHVMAVLDQASCSEQPGLFTFPAPSTNATKRKQARKKNKKKGHTELVVHGHLQSGAVPKVEATACSVSQ